MYVKKNIILITYFIKSKANFTFVVGYVTNLFKKKLYKYYLGTTI